MKIIRDRIERSTAAGEVMLTAEDTEDMWHTYNLIQVGDTVTASTIRRVIKESSTGATSSARTHTKLTVRVVKTEFDAVASHLRVSGPVAAENSHVSLGDYHTLDLEVNQPFTIIKEEGGWDSIALETLKAATDAVRKADLWVVMMREGYANICLVTEYRTVLRQRVDVSLPKKRGTPGRDGGFNTSLSRFHRTLLNTLLRQVDLNQYANQTALQPPPVIIASPGFSAANFIKYIRTTAESSSSSSAAYSASSSSLALDDPYSTSSSATSQLPVSTKALRQFLPNIHLAHSNNASISSIPALLGSPHLRKAVEQSKSGADALFLDKFHKHLLKDDDRAWYGRIPVLHAFQEGLIAHGCTVLLDDRLFRANETIERKRWVSVVDSVRTAGAECRIASSAHQVGKRLEALGGVVVLLVAPAPHLADADMAADSQANKQFWEGLV